MNTKRKKRFILLGLTMLPVIGVIVMTAVLLQKPKPLRITDKHVAVSQNSITLSYHFDSYIDWLAADISCFIDNKRQEAQMEMSGDPEDRPSFIAFHIYVHSADREALYHGILGGETPVELKIVMGNRRIEIIDAADFQYTQ